MQTVIVTGAGGGMGQSCCKLLLNQGWHVLAIDRHSDRLAELGEHPSLTTLVTELTAPELIPAVEQLLQQLPPLAGLVNMAGISAGAILSEQQQSDWQRSFAVNVDVPMRLSQMAAKFMVRGGSIVNIGSPVGIVGARKPAYAASKAALHGLTMSCARNLGPQGIRVNLLLPGPTITRMTADWSDQRCAAIAEGTFLNRLCQPIEIAQAIAFLLSPNASYFTGSVMDMTAGSLWGH